MRITILLVLCTFLISVTNKKVNPKIQSNDVGNGHNVIVVTIDGLRWQELFGGADSMLINDTKATSDTLMAKLLYNGINESEKRRKLMPFLWSVVAQKGSILGNRNFGNYVNVKNIHAVSYPGYNEMFTGNEDASISSNSKVWNNNYTIFEKLNSIHPYKNKVAIFSSWDVFPYIFNTKRNNIYHNCGHDQLAINSITNAEINTVQMHLDEHGKSCRNDMLTYLAARNYIKDKKPKALVIGLGETDEYAHKNDYLNYLQKANEADKIIAMLWQQLQSMPEYKGNTSLVITTDHGRGMEKHWTDHGANVKGSSQTWMAILSPNMLANGEALMSKQYYQKQIAATVAKLCNVGFDKSDPIE